MAKKQRHLVRGQCPQCACGDVSFIPSETMKEKYIGPEQEIEILCPPVEQNTRGTLVVEEEKE